MKNKKRVHSIDESSMISAGNDLADFVPSSNPPIPQDARLVPYTMLHKDPESKAEWDRVLRTKYTDQLYLKKIDSMAMYLVHRNMLATIVAKSPTPKPSATKKESRVEFAKRLWDNSMKHTVLFKPKNYRDVVKPIRVNTSAIYCILEFLGGGSTSWKSQPPKKSRPKKRKHDEIDSPSPQNEELEALEMWKSPDVKRSLPTILLNFKLVCKEMYKLIDWRAIAFAFQRYVHPSFKIPSAEGWDDVAYFRDYVLRRCVIPDYPPATRGTVSVVAMQPLLHRYANFCNKRIGVVMYYTRTASAITRRIFFVGGSVVDKLGTPQIPRKSKIFGKTHHWADVKHIRSDMVRPNGTIHVESDVKDSKPMFCAVASGWNALDPDVYLIAESQEVFCGTIAKSAIEKVSYTDTFEGSNKKDNEEEEEEEGEDDRFESHDGWLEFDDEIAQIEEEIEGEGEYVGDDDEEDEDDESAKRPQRPVRRPRRTVAHGVDWLKDEDESELVTQVKRGKKMVCGIMDAARNEIDDLDEEEEFQFKTKRRKHHSE